MKRAECLVYGKQIKEREREFRACPQIKGAQAEYQHNLPNEKGCLEPTAGELTRVHYSSSAFLPILANGDRS